MRMTRSLLLAGTVLPALILSAPALARAPHDDGAQAPSKGTAGRIEGRRLAQLDEPRGGGGGGGLGGPGGGPRGGAGGEHGGPGRGGVERAAPPAARERPEPPAARERPEPRQAPAVRERPEPPAARERPEPRQAPALRERPEPATPPAARERPEPRQAPALRERPEPPAAREAPERPERTRPTPPAAQPQREERQPQREERTPPAQQRQQERQQAPGQPARPTPPANEEPTRPAPTAPTRPTPPATPPATPPTPPAQRGAPEPRVPGATPPSQTPPSQTPPGQTPPNAVQPNPAQPSRSPDTETPGTPPGQRGPGARQPGAPANPDATPPAARQPDGTAPTPPTAPNQRPGVPGRPFVPPGQTPPGTPPGQTPPGQTPPGQTPPNAVPGQPQPGQIPGQPPGQAPGQLQPGQPGYVPGQTQPGQQPVQPQAYPPGTPPDRDGYDRRGGSDYDRDRDRRGDYDRRDDRRDRFNAPGRPGYVPGGFRDDDDGIRDYERIRRDRREYDVDGRTYYREPGRIIVRDRDGYFIRHDENERFRDLDRRGYRSERRGGEVYSYVDRPGGEQIVTVVDDDGRLLRRYRRTRDGREVILINNAYGPGGPRPIYDDVVDLPPPDIRIPRDRYVVDYERADRGLVYGALTAPPVVAIDRRYTLDQVRYSPQLRARMPSVDINTITFDTGSFTVSPDQARQLQTIADAINQAVRANPQEVFLIEGYTDAVGADIDNLSLSDRRAQSVATVLTQQFQVPPENLTTQGYGEQYLKVNTQGPSRENRRVTVRRITPLLQQQAEGQQGAPPAPPR